MARPNTAAWDPGELNLDHRTKLEPAQPISANICRSWRRTMQRSSRISCDLRKVPGICHQRFDTFFASKITHSYMFWLQLMIHHFFCGKMKTIGRSFFHKKNLRFFAFFSYCFAGISVLPIFACNFRPISSTLLSLAVRPAVVMHYRYQHSSCLWWVNETDFSLTDFQPTFELAQIGRKLAILGGPWLTQLTDEWHASSYYPVPALLRPYKISRLDL